MALARTASRPFGHSVSVRTSQPTRSFLGVRGAGSVVFGAMLFAATVLVFLPAAAPEDFDDFAVVVVFDVFDVAPMAGDDEMATKPHARATASGRGERRGMRSVNTGPIVGDGSQLAVVRSFATAVRVGCTSHVSVCRP